MITGSMVALVTPMLEDGSLDWQGLGNLIDWHIETGTDAIVAVGTTGESATLDMDEHCEVIRSVVARVAGRIPVIAGTGGNAGQINYSAAKAGILGVTKTMAKEWGRYKVNVNAVAFGPIRTRLTEGSADGDSTIKVEEKEIKVGVNPDLLSQMERMIPLGRVGTPEEAAGAVYLLSLIHI